uniref:Ubiquitin carboxyl-terminal hydrolase 36 n=1 Tax=Macrostomum lignano TaxID=282301 RepID=A0A1I8FPT3_9PLAT
MPKLADARPSSVAICCKRSAEQLLKWIPTNETLALIVVAQLCSRIAHSRFGWPPIRAVGGILSSGGSVSTSDLLQLTPNDQRLHRLLCTPTPNFAPIERKPATPCWLLTSGSRVDFDADPNWKARRVRLEIFGQAGSLDRLNLVEKRSGPKHGPPLRQPSAAAAQEEEKEEGQAAKMSFASNCRGAAARPERWAARREERSYYRRQEEGQAHHVSTCRIVPSVDKNVRSCAVCEFVRYYKRYSCGPGSACYPRAFMNRLSAISPTMRLNRQEDAHEEFLRGLLDYMESNLFARRASNPIRVLLFCGKLKSSRICSKCGGPVADIRRFHGSKPVHPEQQQLDRLSAAVCIRRSVERLQRLQMREMSHKSDCQEEFQHCCWPPILTIQLNRFQWGHNSKISRFVEFPLSLDLRPFMSKRGRPVQYDLYSVVIHHGASTKFGHYYCYAKRNEAWWCLNDASVERISETRVLNSCPYILFYRRTDPQRRQARVPLWMRPHPTPPIAAAPTIPASSIPTSQTAAVRSIPSTSTIRGAGVIGR